MALRNSLGELLVRTGNSIIRVGNSMKGESARSDHSGDSTHRRLVNWQILRFFGQTNIAMATALTPFIGYAVLFHDKVKVYLGGLGGFFYESSKTTPPWLSFDERLQFLYMGLLLLGIGSIVYRLIAPNTVKVYGSIEEYTERVAEFLTVRNIRMMYANVDKRNPGLASPSKTDHVWLDTKIGAYDARNQASNDKFYDQVKLDVVRSYYNVESRYTKRTGAWLVSLLFVVGGIMTAVPGSELSIRVICSILG